MTNFAFAGRDNSIVLWLDQLTTPPMTHPSISLSAMATTGDGSDPWDWDVEKVVQELCTANRSWQPQSASKTISDPSSLEQALRHHEVNGCVLLEHVDDTVMKDDLGLKVLGRRAFVRSAIAELRLISARYQAYRRTHHPENVASSEISRSIYELMQHFPAHSSAPGALGGQPQQFLSSIGEPALGNGVNLLEPTPPSFEGTLATNRNSAGEYLFTDEAGNKRRKLNFPEAAEDLEPQFENSIQDLAEDNPAEPNKTPVLQIDPGSVSVDVNGKKRKRIAPTLITPFIDPNREQVLPAEADIIVHNVHQSIDPGAPVIGDDCRHKLVPILIPQPDNGSETRYNCEEHLPEFYTSEHAASSVGEASSHVSLNHQNRVKRATPVESSTKYLGIRKMPVDDLFYKGTAVGQELSLVDEATEFAELPKMISAGRRLYVHGIMRNFLRTERQVIIRGGRVFSAVRPYPEKLAPKFQNPSFTLYSTDNDGQIHAYREEVPSWPEIDPNAVVKQSQSESNENTVTFNPLGPEMFMSSDSLDPSNLQKYMHLEGGDEVLPLYGESDEENEYDLATWKEIEEERGELQRPLQSTRKPRISREEINEAIDEGIAELVTKWNEKIRPKREKKAFRLWNKSRHMRTTREQILGARKYLAHIIGRIAKMRKEILNDVWTSKPQVQKQTRIMELSIFAREDLTFKIRTLEQKTAPQKSPPDNAQLVAECKKSTGPSDDGEEGESIGSESEETSSGDDMDDFVVPDEALPTTEDERHELNLADSEDEDGEDGEDATMSDASIPNTPRDLPTTPTRQIRLKDSKQRKPTENVESDMEDFESLSPPSVNNISTPDVKDEEPILPEPRSKPSNAVPEMVDLTMLSSDDSPARQIVNLITPGKKRKPLIKLFNRNSPFGSSPITLSDSNNETFPDGKMPDPENMPRYDDPAAIDKYSYKAWARSFDKERLLIKVFYRMAEAKRAALFEFIPHVSDTDLWGNMTQVIDTLVAGDRSVRGMDASVREIITGFIRLFVMFVEGRYHPDRESPTTEKLRKVLENKNPLFTPFYKHCCQMEGYFDHSKQIQPPAPKGPVSGKVDDDDEDGEPLSANRRRPRDTT